MPGVPAAVCHRHSVISVMSVAILENQLLDLVHFQVGRVLLDRLGITGDSGVLVYQMLLA